MKNIFPRPLTILFLLLSPFLMGAKGCGGFFGDEVTQPASDAKSQGLVPSELLGQWSYVEVSIGDNYLPKEVYLSRFVFDGQNRTTYFTKDLLSKNSNVIAVSGRTFYDEAKPALLLAFDAGEDPTHSLIGAGFQLWAPEVHGKKFIYGTSHQFFLYPAFLASAEAEALIPEGVWQFSEEFGFDYLAVGRSGYGVAQLRDDTGVPILVDFMWVPLDKATAELRFFAGDPDQVISTFSIYGIEFDAGVLTIDIEKLTFQGKRLFTH